MSLWFFALLLFLAVLLITTAVFIGFVVFTATIESRQQDIFDVFDD